jgi:nicotinamidase-related amidase
MTMDNRYTLVIIDMQEEFIETAQHALTGVFQAIRRAKANKSPILVVEYKSCGNTLPEIRRALKGYSRVRTVTKFDDDGSEEISQSLRRNRFSRKLRICGVNLDACVRSTIEGIFSDERRSHYSITLLGYATYATNCDTNDEISRFMTYNPNVIVKMAA